METAQARETQLTTAIGDLSRLHESKMSQAEELLNQQKRLVKKLREECQANLEVGSYLFVIIAEATLWFMSTSHSW